MINLLFLTLLKTVWDKRNNYILSTNTQQCSFLLGICFHSRSRRNLILTFRTVKRTIAAFFILTLVACSSHQENTEPEVLDADTRELDSIAKLEDSLDQIIESDYDMSMVDEKKRKDFKENLIRIEKEHGEQWDFCTCAVKKDSAEKALLEDGISDEHFERVWARSEFIDKKCQAFDVQGDQRTPEQREERKKNISDCLKAAGAL